MKSLPEVQWIEATRSALASGHIPSNENPQYLWESVGLEKVEWIEDAASYFCETQEYILVLDPNPQNMPARLEMARISGDDEAPVAHHCSGDEVKKLFLEHWTPWADFYILSADGLFIGMRTHEDTGSASGMWIQKLKAEQSRPANLSQH
jgi:hypothetical protein